MIQTITLDTQFYRELSEQGSSIDLISTDENTMRWEITTCYKNLTPKEIETTKKDSLFEFRFNCIRQTPFFCYRTLTDVTKVGNFVQALPVIQWQEIPFHLELTINPEQAKNFLNQQLKSLNKKKKPLIHYFLVEYSTQKVKAMRCFTLHETFWQAAIPLILNAYNQRSWSTIEKELQGIWLEYPVESIAKESLIQGWSGT